MSSTYLARTVLNARLEVLYTSHQDVENQISFFNEQLAGQYERQRRIWEEENSITQALGQLEAAEPAPADKEYDDDIPF